MVSQRCRLSKKLFYTLKPGQYIMDNYSPSKYERIDEDLDALWKKWRRVNGNTVNIYDSQKECLSDWWKLNSAEVVKAKNEENIIYEGKVTKDIFMEYPDGYYVLFTQYPFDSYELLADRNKLWEKIKSRNGYQVRIFKNHVHCAININEFYGI
jgi:hypothetical protein